MDAATAAATDGIQNEPKPVHESDDVPPRTSNVVHLPAPRKPLLDGYSRPGWSGTITITPIQDSRHPDDEGAAELVVSTPVIADLLVLRLPAAPDGDITVLLAEAEERLASLDPTSIEHRASMWERGVTGTWRAAVSDLLLLAVEMASVPANAH